MSGKIIGWSKIEDVLRNRQNIVLVGGCFDLLHIGHIRFLTQAAKAGSLLVVALESDESIKLNKNRQPLHNQLQRSEMLVALSVVDYAILLPIMKEDQDYDNLVKMVRPRVIAVTKGDPQLKNKESQATKVGAKVVTIDKIKTSSTTSLLKLIDKIN